MNNVRILMFILTSIVIFQFVSAVSFEKPIYDCMTIKESGDYALMNNISLDRNCLKIDADKVEINGNGFFVFGDEGYGIKVMDSKYVEIYNMTIIGFDSGIYFDDVKDSHLYNLIIEGDIGIEIRASDGNTIHNNWIKADKHSLKITTSNENNVKSNYLESSDSLRISTSDLNKFYDNSINTTDGLDMYNSHQNEFKNNNFEGEYLAKIESCRDNVFRDSNSTGKVSMIESSYNDFVNMSLGQEEIEASSKLSRKWYYELNVIDESNQTVGEAYVILKNNMGYVQFATLTNENGSIDRQEVIEYVNNGRKVTDYNDFTLHIKKDKETVKTIQVKGNVNSQEMVEDVPSSEEEVIITNLTVSPSLPLLLNQSSQEIIINFDSEEYPLFVRLTLYMEGSNQTVEEYEMQIESAEDMPIKYYLKENLTNGNYALNMSIKDSKGGQRDILLGYIEINDGSGSNNETPGNENGSGGSSGGGSSGGGGSVTSRGGSARIINITSNNTSINQTSLNQTNLTIETTSEEKGEVSGIARITGAVIGAVSEAGWPFFVVLAILLAILYFVVFAKVEEDHETVVEEISEGEKLPDEVEEDKADVKNKNKKGSKK